MATKKALSQAETFAQGATDNHDNEKVQHAQQLKNALEAVVLLREESRTLRIDLKTATDTVTELRERLYGKTYAANTPDGCLAVIIGQLQAVAVGGSAAHMRQSVHNVADDLDHDGKATLYSYTERLRSAAEAVAQEASLLLL